MVELASIPEEQTVSCLGLSRSRSNVRMGVSCLVRQADPTCEKWAEEWATLRRNYLLTPRDIAVAIPEDVLRKLPKSKMSLRRLLSKLVKFFRGFYSKRSYNSDIQIC